MAQSNDGDEIDELFRHWHITDINRYPRTKRLSSDWGLSLIPDDERKELGCS
jgi:hypothetical protein